MLLLLQKKRNVCQFLLNFCFISVICLISIILLTTSKVHSAQVTLSWDENSEDDVAGYKLYYGTSKNNYDKSKNVGVSTSFTVTGLVSGVKYFFVVTAYDTYFNESNFSSYVTYTVPNTTQNIIPQTNWTLLYVDSEEVRIQDGSAINAFDGNPDSFWHTEWVINNPGHPHEIQIDLGQSYDISSFRYLPRQELPGQSAFINGRIRKYEFYISNDGVNWGGAVANGVFANDTSEKEVLFTTTTGQFIRLKALSEVNGNPWTSAAEINVKGVPSTVPPQPKIIPQTNWTLLYVDSEEVMNQDGSAINAFDGNPDSFWHTEWVINNPGHPHEIQIDLGQSYDISSFRYLPRQELPGQSAFINGRIRKYEFYISNDGVNWGGAVANGVFANDTSEKEVLFTTTTGQFIRLKALSEVNGNPWTSAAEINVKGVSVTGN